MLWGKQDGGMQNSMNQSVQSVQGHPRLYKWSLVGLEETLASQASQNHRREPASGPGEQRPWTAKSLPVIFSTSLQSLCTW